MCGRYFIDSSFPKINEIITKAKNADSAVSFADGDIFPTDTAPILIGFQNKIYARFASWGFRHKIINARAETVAASDTFQKDFALRRAIVAASGFYEWDSFKRKYTFQEADGQPLYFAAIYNQKHEFTIITCPAKEPVLAIHHRMPLCLLPSQFADWLFDTKKAAWLLTCSKTPALKRNQPNAPIQEKLAI